MIGVYSDGMLKIPHIEVLLGDAVVSKPASPEGLSAIAGWGYKPTAKKARTMAEKWGLPYLAVEDGFLRSLGLGVLGYPPISVLVDDMGVYYDATAPSLLEQLIADSFSDQELAVAREAMAAIKEARLSKYNHAPDMTPDQLPETGRDRVLLVDQTRNDASIQFGMADDQSFADMVEAARQAHPQADLYVKVHPDVSARKKRGYLTELDVQGATILDRDVNPLSLLEQMDHVYTVTSQLGFEALLMRLPVHCFGMPFYAGWGLTRDAFSLERRTVQRSLEEVFAAAYMRYARYVDPYSGEPCSIMDAIDILVDQKRHEDRNRGALVCAGFSWWRRGFASHLFKSMSGDVLFRSKGTKAARLARDVGGRTLVWSAKIPAGTLEVSRELGVPVVGVEDGFLRSTGLGSDFYWPYSVCMDTRGAYFDPSGPSDLEVILQETSFSAKLMERAEKLRGRIVGSGVTKYNVGGNNELPPYESGGRPVALVVGQVENDKSVQLGGLGIHSDRELLEAVRKKRPDAYLIYKPHPDVVSGNRKGGAFSTEDEHFYDHMETEVGLSTLFPVIDELHTLTSLSGFEALLREIPVFTYGGPFYAGWGLTDDIHSFPRRSRTLTLNELVAGVLILYPSYYDWRTELFCGPETILDRLAAREEPRQGKARRRMCAALQKVINVFCTPE